MTSTALPTPSTSPPPSDRAGLQRWLADREDELAAAARDVLVNAVRSAASRYLGIQAAADPAALDGIVSSWSTFLSTDFLPMLETITLAASIGSFNEAPEVPDRLVPAWTSVVNQEAVNWAAGATNRLRNVGDDVWARVRSVVTDALDSGRVGEELTQTIHDLTTWTEERADTVARTETLGAYANGTHAGNDALGANGPVEHVWNAVGDARTRQAHQDADGQVRKWGEPFDVGGETMLHPHSPGASAGNVVNCRCVEDVLYAGDRRPDGSVVAGERAAGIQNRPGMGDDVPLPTIEGSFDPNVPHSFAAHIDPETGQWTPERQQLHDQIVRSQVDGLPSQENPEVLFMGGGGGAGKGSTIDAGFVDLPRGNVMVNPDDYKNLLYDADPAVRDAGVNWAGFSHEESSYLSKRIQAAATERRLNYTVDAVGADPGKQARLIAAARQNGYQVRATYVSIEPAEGLHRAAERARRGQLKYERALAEGRDPGPPGREINPAVIFKAHLDANQAFEQVAQMADTATLVDNQGAVPRILARVDNGVWDIESPAGFAQWQARRRDTWVAANPGFDFGDEELFDVLADWRRFIGFSLDNVSAALLAAVASGPVEYRVSPAQLASIGRLTMDRVQQLANAAALGADPGPMTSDEQNAYDAAKAAVDAFPGVAWSPVDI